MQFSAENLFFHHYLRLPARRVGILFLSRRFALWKDRPDPSSGRGSLSISNRIAPASGATSTSLTSTASARR
jgi:hypothetical protein